jgi:hypothetical protein
MRLTCNAPDFLWNEFHATAAYLNNLMAAIANNGRTLFELWFGHKISLSHLKEIGCRAFSLQNPTPSELYARPAPCVLIGYAPQSKAYRLWEPSTSCVFDSYHVKFTEHLNAEPSPFFPGQTLGTETRLLHPNGTLLALPLPLIVPSLLITPSLFVPNMIPQMIHFDPHLRYQPLLLFLPLL